MSRTLKKVAIALSIRISFVIGGIEFVPLDTRPAPAWRGVNVILTRLPPGTR
jgi:hypothetical protein